MKILIVEDHPLVQEILHSVASETFGAPLIDLAGSFAEAAEKVRATVKFDLVLLDLGLPDCGGIYMPPQAMEVRRPAARRRSRDLTHRQLDVLRLIAKGLRNKQIAQRLKIAEDTVKQHARAAYGTLGVSSRTQAMTAVSRRGIRFD
jgi:DNA-binding NarL/FixJ family response regulator